MRGGLLLLMASCAACGSEPPISGAYRDASLVVIVIDTLRADALGAYGGRADVAPELDALAERGIVFEQALAPSSWTRPSHGALFTGIHPRRLGLYRERGEALAPRFETLAELLRARGYRALGATANPTINAVYGFAQGFDSYLDCQSRWYWMLPQGAPERKAITRLPPASEIFRRVLEALDEESGRPVYLQINIMEPHRPGPRIRAEFASLLEDVAPRAVRTYQLGVRQASADVGRFVEEVARRPGLEDALFVITSDHGEGLDSHPAVPGSNTHGTLLYESHVRVPLILYSPRPRLEPMRVTQPVRLLDVLPTLLDLLAVPTPPDLDGRSLTATLRGERTTSPDPIVVETYFRNVAKLGLYTEEWRYFLNRDGAAGLNPRELQRSGQHEQGKESDEIEKAPEVAARLHARLLEWERTHPKVPVTRPATDPGEAEEEQLRALGYAE